jgi:hypothetical protein
MQNFKLYKNYLVRFLSLFFSSRAIERFCFLNHFWIIFGSICQIDFGTQSVQSLSCNVSYYFDYLDEKLIFFDKTKMVE